MSDAQSTHPGRRPLNAMDRGMLAVNRALRGMGCPEFSTQALVWLSGRAEVERVRAAVARLARRYPVLTARLAEAGRNGPHWTCRPDAECPLHEADVDSAKPEAVLDYAGRLLSTPGDLASADPIRFDLLHLSDGRDVFLMQYSHALMDNGDAVPLLREIDRLSEADGAERPHPEAPDLLSEHLRRFPRWRRLKAALRTLDVRFRGLRGRPAALGQEPEGRATPVRFRVAARRLDRPEARALEQRVIRTCGVPSLSMALLGSVFRALEKCKPDGSGAGRNLVAGIGVDLGPPGVTRPVFQTLASVVPVFARPEDLADREALVRTLHRQFRHRLENAADLGTVQLASLFQRPGAFLGRRFADWSVRRLLRGGYSLWYAYFGSLDAVGERFCGTPVGEVYYCASTWPPMGLTLLVNRFRGNLFFQATYVPESAPEPLVNAFLDSLLGDLVT